MTNVPIRDRREDDKRLVDLHVNIPTLAVILIQTFAAAWGLSSLFSENAVQTIQLTEMSSRIQRVEHAVAGSQVLESRMITIENELRFLRVHVEQIDDAKRRR